MQVHPDNLVHLKLAILRHLPVLGTLQRCAGCFCVIMSDRVRSVQP